MIVGAAILPTAPLLVPGVSATMPEGVVAVCDAIDSAVDHLPGHDVVVLLSGPEPVVMTVEASSVEPADKEAGPVVHARFAPNLGAVGRPDVAADGAVDRNLAAEVVDRLTAGRADGPPSGGRRPSLSLQVLSLLVGDSRPFVPVEVPGDLPFEDLAAIGRSIGEAASQDPRRILAVAAGDLSAGLTDASPRPSVEGAADFDARVVDIVDSGRLEGLSRIGPKEAARVAAIGWPSMAALHGLLEVGKIGLVRRHYSAPRGVGYLIAHGA